MRTCTAPIVFSAAAVLIFGAVLAEATTTRPNKVKLTVFFEALCYDSQDFIIRHLYPQYKAFGDQYLDIEFVPFGKAYVYQRRADSYEMRCQHGQDECKLNIVMACGSAKADSLAKEVDFVKCVMEQHMRANNSTLCATRAGIEPASVESCRMSNEGKQRFAMMGEKTPPGIKFVPRVLINGEYGGEELQRRILNDLNSVLCERLNISTSPCDS